MKKITLVLGSLLVFAFGFQANAQKVVVIGVNHTSPDGIAFVATQAISNGEVIYFTDDEYNNVTDVFSSGEAVVQFTASTAIAVGEVIVLKEVSTNTLTVTCSSGSCGTATVTTIPFALASGGEHIYAYSDTDNDPTNGVTEIYSVFYSIAGTIPAAEDPVVDFPNAVVVDGFASGTPDRTEFNASRDGVSRVTLENPSNYTNGSTNADLDTSLFTNLNLAGVNPAVTLASATPASVVENSGNTITYTFTRTGATGSPLTVNFNVGGTATFNTDYTQSGAATFTTTNGTVTIGAGNSSAAVTITPSPDSDLEPDEKVVITIAAGTGYDGAGMAIGTIANDDTENITPLVAVVGTTHTGTEGFSFVALDDISAGTNVFFTENPFDMSALSFLGSEAVLQWTAPAGGVLRGEVIVATETSANNFTTSCNSGSCGTVSVVSGNFDLASNGEAFFAYQDTDTDHTNGITQVDAVLFTGTTTTPGGTIPAAEDPTNKYVGSVLVDGFPAVAPSLTEYDPSKRGVTVDQANFQNTANWLHAQPAATLNTTPFSNITIATGSANPAASVTVSPASVSEDGATNLVFTFALDETATSDITVNFTVGGTATFNTDYTVSGSATFDATSGTVVISNGTSSAQVTVDPTVDSDVEVQETVEIMIAAGSGYDGGSPNDATGTITNDDTSASMPLVALTGLNHTPTDGFSFVAAEDIPAGTTVYFTEDEFDNTTLLFESGGEAVLQWTSPGFTIPKGDVIVVNEPSANTFALTCSGTGGADCGILSLISGSFSTATDGETFYAYADDDTDPTNGVTDIYAVIYTGVPGSPGGTIPAVEDPSGIFLNALVVDGFPATAPDRTEYDPTKRNVPVAMADFENLTNWLHAQSNAILSTTPFTDLMIAPVDLELEKSVDNATPNVGGAVVFTVLVSNQGGSDATGVEVTDLLPSGYTFTGFTTTQGTYNSSTGVWAVGTLTSAQTETMTLSATVNASGDYLNLAEVTAANESDVDSTPGNGIDTDGDMNFVDDPDDEDDGDGAEVTPVPVIDLELEKSVNVATPLVGDAVVFTITVSNQGSPDATGVEVTDQLPSGYTFTGFTTTQGTYNSSTGVWSVGTLSAAQTETMTLSATVNATGDYINLAEVTAANETDADSTPGNGVDTDGDGEFVDDPGDEDDGDGAEVSPVTDVDLELEKSVNVATPLVGDVVTFTVNVTNQGPATATGVEVTDLLPSGYTYTGFTTSQGTYNNGSGLWTLGTLAAAQVETLTLSATVNASGDYMNLAEVTAANEPDVDSTPNNGVDTDSDGEFVDDPGDEDDGDGAAVTPNTNVDLELEKSVNNATPLVGDVVTFTVNVTNQGPATATGVEVTDLLPSGYTYTGFTTSQGTYNNGSGLWTLGTLAAAQVETLTLSATVNASGDYMNLAEVTATNEPDVDSTPNNGVDTDSDGEVVDDPGDEDDGDGAAVTPLTNIDLELEMGVDNAVPNVGDLVAFTIVITNQGPATATAPVSGTVNFGSGYVDVINVLSVTNAVVVIPAFTPPGPLPTVSWQSIPGLAPGESVTIILETRVGASGDYLALAEVTSANETDVDSTPGNGVDTDGDMNFADDPGDEDDGDGEFVTPAASVGDRVFDDQNLNGLQDPGEPGVGGVEVSLQDCSGSTLATTTTAGDGSYQFSGLQPNLGYKLGFALPPGYVFAAQDVGGDETIDSDVDMLGLTSCFTLAPGEENNDYDAGIHLDQLVISQFVLVNADTNADIMTLSEGDVIDVATLPTMNLNIRANATSDAESVQLILSGSQSNTRTENVAPYALFGDVSGNYNPHLFAIGTYNLTATAYSADGLGGMAGVAASINFEVVNNALGSPLILVDSATDTELMPLTNGAVINKSVLGDLLFGVIYNASLNPNGVSFNLTGPINESRVEGYFAPYSLFGDFGVDIQGRIFPPGAYTLVANPNSGPDVMVHFTVVNEDPACTTFDAFVNSQSDPTTCEGMDGEIVIGVTGFAAPLTYDWSHNMGLNNATASGLAAGTYTVVVTDDNGCTETLMVTLDDPPSPIVTFTAPADLLITDGVQAGLGGGTPTGGVYSGPGVTDDGNGMTYSFDPAAAGAGIHTLTYTYTDGNGCSGAASDDVEVTDPTAVLSVTGFVLVNADTDSDIMTLLEGSVIDLSTLPTTNLNIRANTTSDVESVRLNLTGPSSQSMTENFAPYALFGDISGDYLPGSLPVGSYTLTATPYSENGLGGTMGTALTINFSVTNDGGGFLLKLYPNPAVSELQVEMVDAKEETEIYAIQVHDMQGRLVKSYSTQEVSGSNEFKMPVYSMQSGVYTMTLVGNKGTVQRKTFVVNR